MISFRRLTTNLPGGHGTLAIGSGTRGADRDCELTEMASQGGVNLQLKYRTDENSLINS
jgi:hypothetical protein